MSDWSLHEVLSSLHDDVEGRLEHPRKALAHPVAKGDASESVWRKLLQTYLPKRYRVTTAHIVDSEGMFSEQIDVVVMDRQYTPLILEYEGQVIVPAESVYAVFEAKQTINAHFIRYAQEKVASVRRLHRTSLPIPHAGGVYPPKPLPALLGGILALDSDWHPSLGEPLRNALEGASHESRLDIGCVASHGVFTFDRESGANFSHETKAATAFLLELIAQLQAQATVPMIDVRAYARWLK